jgi:CheY-like chemotaxis protein
MHGSNERATSGPRLSWPILRLLKGWLGGDAPGASSWDTATLAPAEDAQATEPCVLVVDDNPLHRMLTSEMLSYWGIKHLLAADGAEAVALASEVRLDLILMDLQMPVLDGLAATRQIRRGERASARARVPVLAYTSTPPGYASLSAFGIDGVLDKPCDAIALRDCFLRWCPSKGHALAPA